MPYYARVFLVVGVIVTILNLVGVSEVPTQFSWILLLIGIVLAAIYGLTGRSARVAWAEVSMLHAEGGCNERSTTQRKMDAFQRRFKTAMGQVYP